MHWGGFIVHNQCRSPSAQPSLPDLTGKDLVDCLPIILSGVGVILTSVFNEIMSVATSGSDVPIFKRFQQFWKCVDQSNYKTGIDNEEIARSTQNDRDDVISFAMQQLEINEPKDDYRRFL